MCHQRIARCRSFFAHKSCILFRQREHEGFTDPDRPPSPGGCPCYLRHPAHVIFVLGKPTSWPHNVLLARFGRFVFSIRMTKKGAEHADHNCQNICSVRRAQVEKKEGHRKWPLATFSEAPYRIRIGSFLTIAVNRTASGIISRRCVSCFAALTVSGNFQLASGPQALFNVRVNFQQLLPRALCFFQAV